MFNFKDIKSVDAIQPAKIGAPGFPAKKGLKFLGVERIKNEGKADHLSMQFNFIDPVTQAVLNHREFYPKRQSETQSDDDFKKSVSLSVSRIAHITRAFVSQEEFEAIQVSDPNNMNKIGDNWIDITTQVGKLLKKKLTEDKIDTTCDLKITLRKVTTNGKTNYYSSLPQVPPFISTTNHPKEFKVDPKYDIFEQPRVAPDSESPAPQGTGLTNSPLTAGAGTTAAASGESDF
jgi:hypothetical protein